MGGYKRIDSSRQGLLCSTKNMFEIIGKELDREEEMKEYRRLFDQGTNEAKVMQDYPIHIDFELNFICNYRCRYCVMSLPDDEKATWGNSEKNLSFEDFKRIIDEGMTKGLKSISFNGLNEPLTIEDLPRYIKYASEKRVLDIMFNTNGSLLSEEKARQLVNSGLTRIMISLDAFEKDTYEKYRVNGNYKKVKNNILNFLKIRNEWGKVLPLVRLSFIVHSNNHNELPDFVNYWKDKVDFFCLQNLTNGFVFNEYYSEEFRKRFKIIEEKIDQFMTCFQPFVRVLIRHNGNVIPCCSTCGLNLAVGNIHQDSLYSIWNGERMKEIRNKVNDISVQPGICKKCREARTRNFDLEECYNNLNL